MDFQTFNHVLQEHIAQMLKDTPVAFVADITGDELWEAYLAAFPEGMNPLFRKRREYDCSCCRNWMRRFGNVITVDSEYNVITAWDLDAQDADWQQIANTLASLVKSRGIAGVFVTKEPAFGTDHNFEQMADHVHTWNHFHTPLPKHLRYSGNETVDTVAAKYAANHDVLSRTLESVGSDTAATVLDLNVEGNLYRGDEFMPLVTNYLEVADAYQKVPTTKRDAFCWLESVRSGGTVSKIKNTAIGTLLENLAAGMDVEVAVRKYESVVAPANYKRPKEIVTARQVADAQAIIEELGYADSLQRRYAHLSDISVADVLFADRDAKKKMDGLGGIMSQLATQAQMSVKQFENVPAMGVDEFLAHVGDTEKLEVFLENRLTQNLITLTAAENQDAPTMFKWNNSFAWAYSGNLADSDIKQRVIKAGGKVDGLLRFSLAWEHDDDLDAHCYAGNQHIYFASKEGVGIELDVDQIPMWRRGSDGKYVENIVVTKLAVGKYEFKVHCYSSQKGGRGFTAELAFGDQVLTFEYKPALRQSESVEVVTVTWDGKSFQVQQHLQSTDATRKLWSLDTNRFHRVSLVCHSPNHWGESKVGNRHTIFALAGCVSDETPNGFFNEHLSQELLAQKRVMAALGRLMQVTPGEDQVSGVGFSSTQRNYVYVRVNGTRIIKVVF